MNLPFNFLTLSASRTSIRESTGQIGSALTVKRGRDLYVKSCAQ